MITKTILITGSTDGIGLQAARALAQRGHDVLLHGRSQDKLDRATAEVSAASGRPAHGFLADLSSLEATERLADAVADHVESLDVLINNAGVFNAPSAPTVDGFDIRFAVNTIAPYLLTRRLLPRIPASGRVINLSSAAQAPMDPRFDFGPSTRSEQVLYAQSKLALTMWSFALADALGEAGPLVVSVNPGSLLATKMVKEAFGVSGKDVGIGSDILVRSAESDVFEGRAGQYFDNDSGDFGPPHPDGTDIAKSRALLRRLSDTIAATP